MTMIPLEDTFADVVGKAQRGLRLSDTDLAQQAGVSTSELGHFKGGGFDADTARKIAGPLQLAAGALMELGQKSWRPAPVEVAGLAAFNTAFEDMTVNSYLVFDSKAGQAAAFDTGASAAGMLAFIKERKLGVELILLTHTHPDHVADLSRLEKATGVAAYVSEREEYQGPRPFEAGVVFQMGRLNISFRLVRNASLNDTAPPPIEAAKSASPTTANCRFSPLTT